MTCQFLSQFYFKMAQRNRSLDSIFHADNLKQTDYSTSRGHEQFALPLSTHSQQFSTDHNLKSPFETLQAICLQADVHAPNLLRLPPYLSDVTMFENRLYPPYSESPPVDPFFLPNSSSASIQSLPCIDSVTACDNPLEIQTCQKSRPALQSLCSAETASISKTTFPTCIKAIISSSQRSELTQTSKKKLKFAFKHIGPRKVYRPRKPNYSFTTPLSVNTVAFIKQKLSLLRIPATPLVERCEQFISKTTVKKIQIQSSALFEQLTRGLCDFLQKHKELERERLLLAPPLTGGGIPYSRNGIEALLSTQKKNLYIDGLTNHVQRLSKDFCVLNSICMTFLHDQADSSWNEGCASLMDMKRERC